MWRSGRTALTFARRYAHDALPTARRDPGAPHGQALHHPCFERSDLLVNHTFQR